MAQITNLSIKNFKSLRNVDLELRPLNILIGQNGAGKSNFISFFNLLSQAANEKLAETLVNRMGGLQQVIYYSASTNDAFEWEMIFSGLKQTGRQNPDGIITYRTKINTLGDLRYTIGLEEAERPPFGDLPTPFKFITVTNGHIRILSSAKSDSEKEEQDVSSSELAIAQIRDKQRYPALFELRELISNWTTFKGFGDDVLENIRGSQYFTVVNPLRLDPTGVNIVSVFQELKNNPKYKDTYEQLIEVLQVALPDFDRFDVTISAGGQGVLQYGSRYFPKLSIPPRSMSDGQLRFLGLAILLLLPDPPPLIAIDEPEVGLHPELLPIVANLLKEASHRTQVIVSTHSPQLLNSPDIMPDDIVLVERESGETILERPDTERLERWLKLYSLGNLWVRGVLS